MKRDMALWQFFGFAFTAAGGTLLHFLYEWTGQSPLAAPFSGVNESTWEHMKLLFFPMFFFALLQSQFFKECENFWCIKLIGSATGLVTIPVLFYTYNGILGKSPDWINIAIFFVSAAVAFFLENRLFKRNRLPCKMPFLALGILLLISVLFAVFTFFPPQIPLFRDPITGNVGIGSGIDF